MAIISPVSDLRNYNTVLEQVSAGSPVYLTVNGRGRFTIRDIADDEEFEKAKAMLAQASRPSDLATLARALKDLQAVAKTAIGETGAGGDGLTIEVKLDED